jgi:type I restriction enzyme S subunit
MSWNPVTLGELIEIKHGFAFKGAFFSDAGQYILLTPGNCHESGGLKLKGSKEKYYTGDIPEDYLLSIEDLLVVMTDLVNTAPILGGAFIIPEDDRYLHNQRLGLVIIKDKTRIHKKFLYYLLNTNTYRGQVRGSASGATVRHTSPDRIKRCEVRIPDSTKEQNRIASILSAYDDLIENNRRRIQLLEQAARLLYKEWFVYLRFPGHENVNIKDGVPEGWEKKTVLEVIEIKPKEAVPKGTPIRYVPMTCLSTTGMTVDLSDVEVRTKSTSVRYRNGDILFARITPCLENGKTGFVNFLREDEVACGSTEFIVLRGSSVSPYFAYCLARTHDFRETAIKSMIGSSGRQRVQPSCFDDFIVARPPRFLRDEFDRICEPIFSQIAELSSQVQSLTQARDLLLPRLMNGEVAV